MVYLGVEYGTKFVLEGPYGARAVFNDSTDADYVGDLTPESSGLDAPEIREDSNDRVESDGALFGDFFSGKRPVILQGNIIAISKAQRNERVGKLRAASNAKTTDATLWWEDAAAGKVFVNLRRQQPLRVSKGWGKEFQLAMVAADSRILSYTAKTTSKKGVTSSSQEKAPTVTGEHSAYAGNAWVNNANVKASDNVYATSAMTAVQNTRYIYGKTYGFTIPAGASITGIEVKPEGKSSAVEAAYALFARVSRNIASVTVIEEDGTAGRKYASVDFPIERLSTSDTVQTIGNASDLWNYSKYLTPTLVNNANFGAGMVYQTFPTASTISLDYLPIKITYAEPAEVTATNEGDVAAPALIKVVGPLENFVVRNETTGEFLTYTGKVEAGKEIWFDTQNITVTEHGTGITEPIDRFANVGLPNDWISVAPGANKILVAGTGGSAATELTVEYRSAWE